MFEMLLKVLITLLLSLNFSNTLVPVDTSKPETPPPVTSVPNPTPEEERRIDTVVVPLLESYNSKIALIEYRMLIFETEMSKNPDSEFMTEWEEGLQKAIEERDALIAERDKHYPAP